MSDFILDPTIDFIPDPIWLIDMLWNDLKQLDQMDRPPEEDVQLYEWTLALIGRKFPDAAWYALEAFQNILSARMKEEKTSGPRRRPEELTEGMLSTLAVVSQLLQNEEDRQRIARLTELVRKWPEQYTPKAAEPSPVSGQNAQAAQEAPEHPEATDDPETQHRLQKAASETYREMKKRQQEEINAFPMAFAFSKTQLAEGMQKLGLQPTDTDQIVSIGGGGFVRKTDVEAFHRMFRLHRLERKSAMDVDRTGDGFLLEMFRCELADHEYGYTRDAEPALDALGMTFEELAQDDRLMHAFHKACRQEAEWYDTHC